MLISTVVVFSSIISFINSIDCSSLSSYPDGDGEGLQCIDKVTTIHSTATQQLCSCPTTNADTPNGLGYGDCDCDKNLNLAAQSIEFYYDGYSSDVVCSYNDIQFDDDIICNILDVPGTPYTDFRTDTEFIITHSDGTQCLGQFHTSCSQDIVGEWSGQYGDCNELFCIGWKDGNPIDNNDCDNDWKPCDSLTPQPTSAPSYTHCYCQNSFMSLPNANGLGYGAFDCDKHYGLFKFICCVITLLIPLFIHWKWKTNTANKIKSISNNNDNQNHHKYSNSTMTNAINNNLPSNADDGVNTDCNVLISATDVDTADYKHETMEKILKQIDDTEVLFSVDNKTLHQHQQQIIEALGGFRALLIAAATHNKIQIGHVLYGVLTPKRYDPAISLFVNATTNILCDLVNTYCWCFVSKLNEFNPTTVEAYIAGIIFDFASVWNIWTLPNDNDISCDSCSPNMIKWYHCDWDEPERRADRYHTAFIHCFKIDPEVVGKYSCSMRKYDADMKYAVFLGVMDANKAGICKSDESACVGFSGLSDGYAYCFDRGGLYHEEVYNTRYSTAIVGGNDDIMNVYITIEKGNKATLDWGINDEFIGTTSIDIDIPQQGLVFAISAANWETPQNFILKKISTPNHTFTFE